MEPMASYYHPTLISYLTGIGLVLILMVNWFGDMKRQEMRFEVGV